MRLTTKTWIKRITLVLLILIIAAVVVYLVSFFGDNMAWNNPQFYEIDNRKLELTIDSDGYYTFTKEDNVDFKVLQITDFHISTSIFHKKQDASAFNAVYKLIKDAKPDLVVFTGDMSYPSFYKHGLNSKLNQMKALGGFMSKLNVRWAAVFGNHDAETGGENCKQKMAEYMEGLENCLFQSGPTDIKGIGNYIININNSDGTINSSLVLMDSNMYRHEGKKQYYDNIGDDQIAWYEQEINKLAEKAGHIVPTHAFFHIPLQEYKKAYDLYLEGSDEVTYYFGERGEKECHSPYGNNFFDKMVELNSTKGVYVGHDHVNSYSVEYKGIRLTYGLSIDYLAYKGIAEKTNQRGSTTIAIKNDGSFNITQTKLINV